MSSFGVNVDEIRWIITPYMVTFAIVTLPRTTCVRSSASRLYRASPSSRSALLCGLAWDQASMNLFRIVQALGAASSSRRR
jgi:hypothetical protein